MKKLLIFSFVLLLALSFCSQKEEDSFDRIIKAKKLLVGTDATYPPFESKDAKTGKVVGFDIDLINAICDDLGVECEFIVVPFDGIVSGLKNRKYDAVISAFTITPERQKMVDYSQPYYQAGQSIAVKIDEQKIKSIDDLTGKRIGVQLGTTGEILAKKIEDAEIISYDNIGAAFIDMDNNKLDAIVNDKPTSERIIALKGKAKIVGETLTSEDYGIAVRKGEKRLLDAINSSLKKLQDTGKLQEINAKWFSSPSKTDPY
jgi:polar amino acid transport system substrate-binding protein